MLLRNPSKLSLTNLKRGQPLHILVSGGVKPHRIMINQHTNSDSPFCFCNLFLALGL